MSDTPEQLTDAVRKIVKRGNFSHLSILANDGLFKASFRGVDHKDFRTAENSDPLDALLEVLTGKRSVPRKLEKSRKKETPATVPAAQFDDLL